MESLKEAEECYRRAKASGDRQEEARWANTIGHSLKNKGHYLEALHWFHIDYQLCKNHLPSKHHYFPAIQSIGDIYLRLQRFKEALVYQEKHLQLAQNVNDLVEQQRANTQLGRTYHEMYINSLEEHQSLQKAKEYLNSAMKLAQIIKEKPPIRGSSFIKEYIDAHNNVGLLLLDCDNLEKAEKILTKALDICNQEQVYDDDACARVSHNLGKIYTELRMWDKARLHIEKDIMICNRIEHHEGEAKGYINLGEVKNCVQNYNEAILCYQRARELAKSMEDAALVCQIDDNIKTVKELAKVMDDMKREERNFKKLDAVMTQGKANMRKCQHKKIAFLELLIDKSQTNSDWPKVLEFAKMKKKVVSGLDDEVKTADSFLVIGESYMKLRNFQKALKWLSKSLKLFKSLGNLEGQALTQINIGNVLDSQGEYRKALDAFTDSYRIAHEAKLSYAQLTALENMHFSNLHRFDNVEETRRLQLLKDTLGKHNNKELEGEDMNLCSESI